MRYRRLRRWWFRGARRFTPLVEVDVRDLRLLAPTIDPHVGGKLFSSKRMEMKYLAKALEHVPDRDGVFMDVGANVGTTCLPALAFHGFSRAIAIEPHPDTARILAAAAALNGFGDRVQVVQAAAASTAGTARLALHPGHNSGAHKLSADGELEVSTVVLDELVEPSDVRMVWIDAQGSEPDLLKGAERLIAAGVPFVCEIDPRDDQVSGFFPNRRRIPLRRTGPNAHRRKIDDVLFLAG